MTGCNHSRSPEASLTCKSRWRSVVTNRSWLIMYISYLRKPPPRRQVAKSARHTLMHHGRDWWRWPRGSRHIENVLVGRLCATASPCQLTAVKAKARTPKAGWSDRYARPWQESASGHGRCSSSHLLAPITSKTSMLAPTCFDCLHVRA